MQMMLYGLLVLAPVPILTRFFGVEEFKAIAITAGGWIVFGIFLTAMVGQPYRSPNQMTWSSKIASGAMLVTPALGMLAVLAIWHAIHLGLR